MRFYHLSIFDQQDTGQVDTNKGDKSTLKPLTLSSYVKRNKDKSGFLPGTAMDQFDPGALDIQFDVTLTNLTDIREGHSDAAITIRGVDIYTINQASSLVGRTVSLQVGMGRGLPLSNPHQTGEILHGTVRGSIGNWEDTDLSLTLFVSKYALSPDHLDDQSDQNDQNRPNAQKSDDGKKPKPSGRQGSASDTTIPESTNNYQITCLRGNDLLTAISSALQQVNPAYQVTISIPGPVPSLEDVNGSYRSFKELCVGIGNTWMQQTQKEISITAQGTEFHVSDGSQDSPRRLTVITFHELIGQPSWNGETAVSFTCPMRGDIHIGDIISLPQLRNEKHPQQNAYGLIAQKQEAAVLASRDRCLFSGYFRIKRISHTGKFRSKDGRNWASTFTCEPYDNGNGTAARSSAGQTS